MKNYIRFNAESNLVKTKLEPLINELEKEKENGAKIFPGEKPKTEQHIQQINSVMQMINNELKNIGVKELDYPLCRVHFFDHEQYVKEYPLHSDNEGLYNSVEDYVVIDLKWLESKIDTLIHELLEAGTFKLQLYNIEKGTIERTAKSGYLTSNSDKKHEHFRNLNEAIIDKMVYEILQNNRELIKNNFKIDKFEPEKHEGYSDFIPVIDQIIEKISQARLQKGSGKNMKENKNLVWSKLKKGLFTGEVMHLREIERVFGKRALKILKLWDIGDPNNQGALNELVQEYFEAKTQEEREEVEMAIDSYFQN